MSQVLVAGGQSQLLGRKATAAAAWYAVTGKTCVAAYQPKGAAGLAASYVNLANPGTNNAAPGTAPTFDTSTGWTFAAGNSQYLRTGVLLLNDQSWSVLLRFSNDAGVGVAFGCATGAALQLAPNYSGSAIYSSGGSLNKTGYSSGVTGIAGNVAYKNGTAETGTIPTSAGVFAAALIGARSNASDVANTFWTGKIQALAIYSAILTPTEMATVAAAMALL